MEVETSSINVSVEVVHILNTGTLSKKIDIVFACMGKKKRTLKNVLHLR